MNKKGFTLIELLAVILVIAVPQILNVIEVTNKESLRLTGEMLVKAMKDNHAQNHLNHGYYGDTEYLISEGVAEFYNVDGSEDIKVLPISLDESLMGEGYTDEVGNVTLTISNGKYCALKMNNVDNILIGKVGNYPFDCRIELPLTENCFATSDLTESEVEITKYDIACPRNVTIPNEIRGKRVTSIGIKAFVAGDSNDINGNPITSIIIPEGVTSIGKDAFWDNNLTSVIIPESVTSIGDSAFSSNQLTSVIIPESVTSIGDSAFSSNQLTSVIIPNSVTSIGSFAFYNNQLTSVVIPSSVTSIGEGAFYWNQLTSVVIPSSVTSIGDWAFSSNQLTSVDIPSSVTSIGNDAFAWNQLTSITIPSSVTSIESQAFFYNQLTSVTIPSSVTSIGGSAFSSNKLTSVTIPSSVTSIGNYAFENNQLTSVIIPNSVTSIGKYAFYENKLTSITIPSSITINNYSISSNFYTSYVIDNNKAGGTYTAPSQSGTWTKQ